MQHYFVTLFFCLLYATGFSQDPLSSDCYSPSDMGLSGPVKSLQSSTYEAVRDSTGALVKKPGGLPLGRKEELATWTADGKPLTDETVLFHGKVKRIFHYSNGRLQSIDDSGPAFRFIPDSIERQALMKRYPDSLVVLWHTEYRYNFRNRVSKKTQYDDEGSVWSQEHYDYQNGRIVRSTEMLNDKTVYQYDENGLLLEKVTRCANSMGSQTRYTYENGVLIAETQEDLSQEIIIERFAYTYDANGYNTAYSHSTRNRTSSQLEESFSRTNTNDKHGNPVHSTIVSKGIQREMTMSYVYDEHGNWIRKTTIDGDQLLITERTIMYY